MLHYIAGIPSLSVAGPSGEATYERQRDDATYLVAAIKDASDHLAISASITFGQAYAYADIRAWLVVELRMDTYQWLYIYTDAGTGTFQADPVQVLGRGERDRYYFPLLPSVAGGTTGQLLIRVPSVPAKIHNMIKLYLQVEGLAGGVTVSDVVLELHTSGEDDQRIKIYRDSPDKLSVGNAIGRDGDIWIVI